MTLKNNFYSIQYSSDEKNLVRDFYVPCMKEANLYRRAVGYFTSHGLSVAAQGVAHLLNNGGRIQLIASPALTEEDCVAINEGYKKKEETLIEIASKSFDDVWSELTKERLNALSWLIQTGSMEVKLALRVDDRGRLDKGIFHEKTGIFTDVGGNHVAFSGSPNETSGGLIDNYEAIDVFWSWDDPQNRVQAKLDRFKKQWEDKTNGLEIFDFTEATDELLKKYRKKNKPIDDPAEDADFIFREKSIFNKPDSIKLRDYQDEAIINWFKNNGVGILKFATGTGKTITAIAAAERLHQKDHLDALIVIAPFRHLVTQWSQELNRFGLSSILAFESKAKWEPRLTSALSSITDKGNDPIIVVTTNKTFMSDVFQGNLKYFPEKTMLIADEMHNLGAKRLKNYLPENIKLRLGLSATPERWFDEEGTQVLFDYFGPVLEPEIGIKEAIQNETLVPYRYYPILVELTKEETDEYRKLTDKIAKVLMGDKKLDEEENPALTALLMQRARLIATAENKLVALRHLMESKRNHTHMLIYCGDGRVEDPISSEEEKQIEAVMKMLGYDLGIKVQKYVADTSVAERERRKSQLDDGSLQALVAIRCLDEGVDIPSVKAAVILASSQNPRQFIQRRGRILRTAPGKRFAEIFDMIVIPPAESMGYDSERKLLKKEIERFGEFADIAMNGAEARMKILDIQQKYGLLDI